MKQIKSIDKKFEDFQEDKIKIKRPRLNCQISENSLIPRKQKIKLEKELMQNSCINVVRNLSETKKNIGLS